MRLFVVVQLFAGLAALGLTFLALSGCAGRDPKIVDTAPHVGEGEGEGEGEGAGGEGEGEGEGEGAP